MGILKSAAIIGLSAIILAFTWRMFSHLDLGKVPYSHKPGRCRPVEPIKDGSEDVLLLPKGQAVITSGLRYTVLKDLENVVGKLYFYDFNQNESTPRATPIKINWQSEEKAKLFNPHGLKAHIDAKGIITLYVINHEPKGDAIEMFELNTKTKSAKHLKTIRHELIFNANNLAIIGPEEFFVSNDVYFRNSILKQLEFLVPVVKLGSIVYYNKGKASIADQFLFMPNGLDIDKQKKHLFVASIVSKQLWIYDIGSDKQITRSKTIDIGTMPDNVVYDEEKNTVWIGCHPVANIVISYLGAPKSMVAPSQVLEVRFNDKQFEKYTIHDTYADTGEEISASTVAVRYNNQILIGSVYDKLLLCDLD